ncbi:LPXTG cell wall anchor domain-containing protein [Mammaliicoccus sciuri]|uniref:LPXTG cell wall anchor domain-containing protein n=1 Tax=Mammaliicoccus sciuri TaxID=1296 RepID=UPI00398C0632
MSSHSIDSNGNGVAKAATLNDQNKGNNYNNLPDTGEQTVYNSTLLGSLLAGIGSLFLLSRRKKEEKKNM